MNKKSVAIMKNVSIDVLGLRSHQIKKRTHKIETITYNSILLLPGSTNMDSSSIGNRLKTLNSVSNKALKLTHEIRYCSREKERAFFVTIDKTNQNTALYSGGAFNFTARSMFVYGIDAVYPLDDSRNAHS